MPLQKLQEVYCQVLAWQTKNLRMLFMSFIHEEAKTAYQVRGIWLLASDPRDLINKCVDITPGSCGVYYRLLMKQI